MAFKEAYINEVNQQNQGISNITQGVKSAVTLALGMTGFSGGLGDGIVAEGAKHALAGRIGGIGGNVMLAAMQQKTESNSRRSIYDIEDTEAVNKAFDASVAENPSNIKAYETVWNKLTKAREQRRVSNAEQDIIKHLGGQNNDNDR